MVRPDYDPGPCPVCGSTDVETDWVYAPPHLECVGDPETDKNPDHWLPGMSRCLNPECPGRPEPQLCSHWEYEKLACGDNSLIV